MREADARRQLARLDEAFDSHASGARASPFAEERGDSASAPTGAATIRSRRAMPTRGRR